MQVDLDVEGAQVAERPRFQQAQAQGRRLKRIAFVLAALAGLGLVSGFFVGLFSPHIAVSRLRFALHKEKRMRALKRPRMFAAAFSLLHAV